MSGEMADLVERLRFDAVRCELHFSKGVASNIEEAATALEAKDKELAALRAKPPTLDAQSLPRVDALIKALEARAETAERIVIDAWNAFGIQPITTMEEAHECAFIGEGDLDEQIKTQVEQVETAERKLAKAMEVISPLAILAEDCAAVLQKYSSAMAPAIQRLAVRARAITGED